jgi:hypothetical protein
LVDEVEEAVARLKYGMGESGAEVSAGRERVVAAADERCGAIQIRAVRHV